MECNCWHFLTCGQHFGSVVNVCTQTKGLEFGPYSSQCGHHIHYHNLPAPSLKTVLHKSMSYSSAAAVDLDDSQSFPLGSLLFQQWVISSAESEKGGKGSRKGWFIQGSRLPRLVPSLTVSPKHMTRLNPKPQPFYVVLVPQSHLSL